MCTPLVKIAFSAFTTLLRKVSQWVASAGVPPLKWYRLDHSCAALPRKEPVFTSFNEGRASPGTTTTLAGPYDVRLAHYSTPGQVEGLKSPLSDSSVGGPSAARTPPRIRQQRQRRRRGCDPCTERLGSSIPEHLRSTPPPRPPPSASR